MTAPVSLRLVGLGAEDRARLGGLVDLVSRLPKGAEDTIDVIKIFDDVVRSRRGLHFDLHPTGRAGEFRLTLQFSQALCDLCAALGARDLCGEFVGETGHSEASIGQVGTSGVKGGEAGVHDDTGLSESSEPERASA